MTIALNLPADIEARLQAEVRAGRHANIEAAILEHLSRVESDDAVPQLGMSASELRHDLEVAWSDRRGAVNGPSVFQQIAARAANSAPRK